MKKNMNDQNIDYVDTPEQVLAKLYYACGNCNKSIPTIIPQQPLQLHSPIASQNFPVTSLSYPVFSQNQPIITQSRPIYFQTQTIGSDPNFPQTSNIQSLKSTNAYNLNQNQPLTLGQTYPRESQINFNVYRRQQCEKNISKIDYEINQAQVRISFLEQQLINNRKGYKKQTEEIKFKHNKNRQQLSRCYAQSLRIKQKQQFKADQSKLKGWQQLQNAKFLVNQRKKQNQMLRKHLNNLFGQLKLLNLQNESILARMVNKKYK